MLSGTGWQDSSQDGAWLVHRLGFSSLFGFVTVFCDVWEGLLALLLLAYFSSRIQIVLGKKKKTHKIPFHGVTCRNNRIEDNSS